MLTQLELPFQNRTGKLKGAPKGVDKAHLGMYLFGKWYDFADGMGIGKLSFSCHCTCLVPKVFSHQKRLFEAEYNFCFWHIFFSHHKNIKKFFNYVGLWHYRLWRFKTRDTNSERFLHKNQHTQKKLLNFENWNNGKPQQLAKIRCFKVDYFDFSRKKIEELHYKCFVC